MEYYHHVCCILLVTEPKTGVMQSYKDMSIKRQNSKSLENWLYIYHEFSSFIFGCFKELWCLPE